MPTPRRAALTMAVVALTALTVLAQGIAPEWTQPQTPLRLFGNTYYVGTRGVAAILITSDAGHVLIDGGLSETATMIAANIRTLGFRVEDVELIVNSHIHYDHAGGIGALPRLSGARVAASPSSAAVFKSGRSGPDDPQYGILPPIETVTNVHVIADGESLRVGSLVVQGHFTGGHTPGGTSWTWRSCEGSACRPLQMGSARATPIGSRNSFARVSPAKEGSQVWCGRKDSNLHGLAATSS